MNKSIAQKRMMDVLRPDVMHNSRGDFLSTHVPMKKLFVTKQLNVHAQVPELERKNPKTEEEVYNQFMPENDQDQFVLVIGDSGAGKSHLIRWIYTVHELRKAENEILLPIRRADNTLKGTIKQLIDLPEVKNLPNKELYRKLLSASTTVPELELKDTLYYSFIIQIENDDGKAGEVDGERKVSNVDRKHLIALLQNSLFKERLLADGGPIDRIYCKLAENKTNDTNDIVAEFKPEDFEIDSILRNQIENGADDKARKIADKLIDNDEFVNTICCYINMFVEKVIQRCSGLEPGDLAQVILEIRQELYKQGKILTIFIEDITAASGVDNSLLDAIQMNKKQYSDKNLCRVNAIVGSTDAYYREKFRENVKGRIDYFVYVPDDLFTGNEKGLIEFFAKYLNTISLEEKTIQDWIDNYQADLEYYPVHQVKEGAGWGEYNYYDKTINLFPFTKNAIRFLYRNQDVTHRNPRALMREILEPYIKDAFDHFKEFPTLRPTLEEKDPTLHNRINDWPSIDDATKIRLRHFMYVWGNGKYESYTEKGIKYVAEIPTFVYEELGLPIIEGEPAVPPNNPSDKPGLHSVPTVEVENEQIENEQVKIALSEVDKWIEKKDYKLNVGASTKSVKGLNDARKNINDFLMNTIDWVSEGVSLNAIYQIKTKQNFFVAFDRQTMKSEAVITLPATIDSRKIIAAFVRWSELGKNSWNYPDSTDDLYCVQKWFYSIKPKLIEAVIQYDGKRVNYFSYAAAAELYRLILNGHCKNFQSVQNIAPEKLLEKNPNFEGNNGHTGKWNGLMRTTNGDSGREARDTMLQYYNLPQGMVFSTTNYEMDYLAFIKGIRKVLSSGLQFTEDSLQLDDPVKKRRIYSEHLQKIIEKVDDVVSDERTAIEGYLSSLSELIDIDAIESPADIVNIIKDVDKFYSQASDSHISVAIHYNSSLSKTCRTNAADIYKSIKDSFQLRDIQNPQDALIKLSNDPLQGLKLFCDFLKAASNDVGKAKSEAEQKIRSIEISQGESNYSDEMTKLSECKGIIEEVKGKHAAG